MESVNSLRVRALEKSLLLSAHGWCIDRSEGCAHAELVGTETSVQKPDYQEIKDFLLRNGIP